MATTYPEAALLAIARGAAGREQLASLYTTIRVKPWMERLADRAPLRRLRQPLQRELARRSLSDLPSDAFVTVATGAPVRTAVIALEAVVLPNESNVYVCARAPAVLLSDVSEPSPSAS